MRVKEEKGKFLERQKRRHKWTPNWSPYLKGCTQITEQQWCVGTDVSAEGSPARERCVIHPTESCGTCVPKLNLPSSPCTSVVTTPRPLSRFLQPLVPECALFTCGTYPKGWQHYVHQKPKHIPHVHPSNYGADFCGDRCHFMGLCIPISVLHHTKSYRPFHSWQWPYWTWYVAHEGIKDWAENLSPLKIFCTYESIISLPYFMKSIKHDDVFTKVASKLSNTILLP